MGAITGSMDEAALTRLARGVGAVRLVELDEVDEACLMADDVTDAAAPIELRPWEQLDDDDTGGYRVHAAADHARAVAIAHRDARTIRWTYAGVVLGGRAGLSLADRDWDEPWDATPLAESAGGAVRVIEQPDAAWVKAILIEGGESRIAVYVGFDAEEDDVVAIVLDAAGLGGVRDDRDGEEGLRAAHEALAGLALGAGVLPSPRVFEGFVPNLADGVPRMFDYVEPAPCAVTAASVGTLPLPSRTIGLVLGWFRVDGARASAWPCAGDGVDVIAVTGPRGSVVAWMLRVPAARVARWASVGFEDTCVIGDGAGGGGTTDAALQVVDGGWPPPGVGFARSRGGSPLVCVRGLDLSVAHGFVGLDADGKMASLVVIE